ncbi:uncharacterized protein G2W53_003591 [Senna tora]|uniref:Uncharacterized protein n=1 Tax=Senna tora TaxID=362788 RepID=A0A834XBH8_9FABA|nr:uncharacterized protein G2W53_003591 [Senna tora]
MVVVAVRVNGHRTRCPRVKTLLTAAFPTGEPLRRREPAAEMTRNGGSGADADATDVPSTQNPTSNQKP